MDSDDCSYASIDEDASITGGRRKKKFPAFNPRTKKPTYCVEMTFENAGQFKKALCRYAIIERHDLIYTRNTKAYVRMRCKKSTCPQYIFGSNGSKEDVF